jgi:cobalt-zinc-cadmium efflux system membrane fusion protein
MSAAPGEPAEVFTATPRARRLATALVAVLGIVTTSAAAIAVDRAITGRAAVPDEHEHGHEQGAAPRHDEDARGAGRPDDAREHAPHVDVATVTLTDAQRAAADLTIEVAGPATVDEVMRLPGEIAFDADRVAHVTPRAAGAVLEVRADLGAEVKKGDVLAVLDSREVAALQQELMLARSRRELAAATVRRLAPLAEGGVASEKEILAAQQALEEATIDERGAARKLAASAGARPTSTGVALVAPLDGRVVEKHATIGEVLGPDAEAFTVADLSRLWVWCTAHAKELARVRRGQRAYVRADGIDEPLLGRVDYVEAMLGERTRTARARIVVDGPPEAWRPGMLVSVELVIGEVQASVVVREDAVQRLGEHPVVFVEHDGRYEARPVELGRAGRDGEGRLVRAIDVGLRAGARYVATNAFLLKAELGKGSAGHEH